MLLQSFSIMNRFVILVTCIQLFNSPVPAYRQVVTFSAIPCDAMGAVNAADLAVNYINGARRKGYKYRLNRINNAQEKQEQYEFSYYLEFEVFETRCHVRSSKPLKRCEIRPFHLMKAFGKCKIIIRISKGFQNVKDYQCSEYPVENPCQGCIYMIPLNSRDVDRAVQVAIQKYNSESNDTNYFSLFNITRTLRKSVSSQRILVEFVIQETNCFKDDFTVVLSACVPKPHEFASDEDDLNFSLLYCFSKKQICSHPIKIVSISELLPEDFGNHLGFCMASFDSESPDDDVIEVTCDIYATKGVTARGLSGQVEPHEDNYPDKEQLFRPKRKRSISRSKRWKIKWSRKKDSSSSESSEEQQMRSQRVPFRPPTIHYHNFPNLPPHLHTCPGQPRYVLRTHWSNKREREIE
ncbi:antihemorrhagic factor cHLP-B-like isoform X2 [Heterodontus francisci]|uniref:antihemorrhagic factor cHLP-B-like isoform X2 n=1 Tax=Heterodontus francisci TaxID=7792 RepID=UPI00355BF8B3